MLMIGSFELGCMIIMLIPWVIGFNIRFPPQIFTLKPYMPGLYTPCTWLRFRDPSCPLFQCL